MQKENSSKPAFLLTSCRLLLEAGMGRLRVVEELAGEASVVSGLARDSVEVRLARLRVGGDVEMTGIPASTQAGTVAGTVTGVVACCIAGMMAGSVVGDEVGGMTVVVAIMMAATVVTARKMGTGSV